MKKIRIPALLVSLFLTSLLLAACDSTPAGGKPQSSAPGTTTSGKADESTTAHHAAGKQRSHHAAHHAPNHSARDAFGRQGRRHRHPGQNPGGQALSVRRGRTRRF